MKDALKSIRVIPFIIFIFFSVLLIFNVFNQNPEKGIGFGEGLDYGIDFAGGMQMQLKLERPVTQEVMSIEKTIIENRLNSMGLKDIPVRPWGDQYLLVEIAQATPAEMERLENILLQQARFEERIDGNLAVYGDEVSVNLGPQGAGIRPVQGGYSIQVYIDHTTMEAACRFGEVASGKEGRPVDIFIDRPANTTILFSEQDYNLLANLTDFEDATHFYFGASALEVLTERAVLPVISMSSSTADDEVFDIGLVKTSHAILAGDEMKIPDEIRNRLEENGVKTKRNPLGDRAYTEWLSEMMGLKNSLPLGFDPAGECVYNAMITGSYSDIQSARDGIREYQVLLTSGNLPVSLTIESKSTTPPTLGHKFLAYSLYTGICAILAVGLIVFIRYRRVEIVLPIMAASVGDIVMILGFAAFINWELDLPAFAGIIAAVGTGIDHLIVITDETLKQSKNSKRISISERIRKAFFIILTAAATITVAMLPLMFIGAGMLKGFAFTTLMGVLIGVTISRPAYAKVIEILLKKSD